MGPSNHVVDKVHDLSTRRGKFWGMSGALQSIGNLCYGVRSEMDHSNPLKRGSKRDNSIVSNSIDPQ